jgi:hypothetical protein
MGSIVAGLAAEVSLMLQEDIDPELPAPSPELVLMRALIEAHLAMLPPKKALRFLRVVEGLMDVQVKVSAMRQDRTFSRTRAQAAAWWARTSEMLARRL